MVEPLAPSPSVPIGGPNDAAVQLGPEGAGVSGRVAGQM
jgi:hypothetical protein